MSALSSRSRRLAGLTAVVAVGGVGAVALTGGSENGTPATPAAPVANSASASVAPVSSGELSTSTAALDDGVARAFSVFRSTPAAAAQGVTLTDPVLVAAARNQQNTKPSEDQPRIDYARAVPIPAADGVPKAWLAPWGDQVCTVITDANGQGSGGGCSTVAQATRGNGLSFASDPNPGPDRKVTVVALVVDGGKAPTLVDNATGRRTPMVVAPGENAASARVSSNTTLVGLSRTIDMSELAVNDLK